MKNPFEFGRELGYDELVDREDEVREVTRAILNREKLFMIGPRRFGKTSILKAAETAAHARGAVVLRMDAQAYPTLETMIEHLLSHAADQLLGTVKKARDVIARAFTAFRPEITFNPMDETWSISLGARASRQPPAKLLADALNVIERLAADFDRPVACIIDEFQQIIEDEGEVAERQIRAAIQTHRHVAYILAGSATRMLSDMTNDPSRPFYRFGSRMFVGPVPEEDFQAFLRAKFSEGGFHTSEEALAEIQHLAERVPYNVQRLAHGCWDLLVQREKDTLAREDVREALDLWIRRDDPFYTHLWNGLTAIQKRALIAVAEHGSTGLYSKNTLSRFDLTPGNLQSALAALERTGSLRSEQYEGATRWRFEDPFFAAWIRMIV